jgi:hypothetical protein
MYSWRKGTGRLTKKTVHSLRAPLKLRSTSCRHSSTTHRSSADSPCTHRHTAPRLSKQGGARGHGCRPRAAGRDITGQQTEACGAGHVVSEAAKPKQFAAVCGVLLCAVHLVGLGRGEDAQPGEGGGVRLLRLKASLGCGQRRGGYGARGEGGEQQRRDGVLLRRLEARQKVLLGPGNCRQQRYAETARRGPGAAEMHTDQGDRQGTGEGGRNRGQRRAGRVQEMASRSVPSPARVPALREPWVPAMSAIRLAAVPAVPGKVTGRKSRCPRCVTRAGWARRRAARSDHDKHATAGRHGKSSWYPGWISSKVSVDFPTPAHCGPGRVPLTALKLPGAALRNGGHGGLQRLHTVLHRAPPQHMSHRLPRQSYSQQRGMYTFALPDRKCSSMD